MLLVVSDSGLPHKKSLPFELAVAAPAMAWLALAALLLVAVAVGYRALAAPENLTMPEAAALRDEAQILRQVAHGGDPSAEATLRRGIIGEQDYILTPLEAAIAARHADVVEVLMKSGARVDDKTFPRLLCLARLNSAADIVALLERDPPLPVTSVDCSGIRLPW